MCPHSEGLIVVIVLCIDFSSEKTFRLLFCKIASTRNYGSQPDRNKKSKNQPDPQRKNLVPTHSDAGLYNKLGNTSRNTLL